jgi:hypothetical protein
MPRRAAGERPLTNAERQRAYRERHRPQTRAEEFLVKVARLYGEYRVLLSPEHLLEALVELEKYLTFYWQSDTWRETEEGKKELDRRSKLSPEEREREFLIRLGAIDDKAPGVAQETRQEAEANGTQAAEKPAVKRQGRGKGKK